MHSPHAILASSFHGKASVRVAKVIRNGSENSVVEYSVRLHLYGGCDDSFTKGDNANVVATDTCKNHVYMLAKNHLMSTPEIFALDLAHHILSLYDHLTAVKVFVRQRPWKRAQVYGEPHVHGFYNAAHGILSCVVLATRKDTVVESCLSE